MFSSFHPRAYRMEIVVNGMPVILAASARDTRFPRNATVRVFLRLPCCSVLVAHRQFHGA